MESESRIVCTTEMYHNFRCYTPNRNFPKGIISYHLVYGAGKGRKGASVGVICEGTEKVRRKMGARGRILDGKSRVLGWPWSEGDAVKNTSEESKAGGNLRLKTPLSSRELNSNVRVLQGRDKRRRWKDAERRRQMCAHF